MHILFLYFISSCNGSDTHANINIYIYVAQCKPTQQSYKFMDLVKSYTLLSDQLWFLKSWVWSSKTPNSDPKSQCPSNAFFKLGEIDICDRVGRSDGSQNTAPVCAVYIYQLHKKKSEFKRCWIQKMKTSVCKTKSPYKCQGECSYGPRYLRFKVFFGAAFVRFPCTRNGETLRRKEISTGRLEPRRTLSFSWEKSTCCNDL